MGRMIGEIAGFFIFSAALVVRLFAGELKKGEKAVCMLLMVSGFCIVVAVNLIVIVPAGYTGVRTTFGQVDETAVQNGLNWKIPFVQEIKKVNNKYQDITFEGMVRAETSDGTAMSYGKISITYQINPEKSAWVYVHVDDYEKNLITQQLVEYAIKISSKAVNSTDDVWEEKIETLTVKNMQKALDAKYGEKVVKVSSARLSRTEKMEASCFCPGWGRNMVWDPVFGYYR